jgi:large subunit ribosomal protein L23
MANSIYDILLRPVVTEKSTSLSAHNKVVFKVLRSATKAEIKEAVEKIFKTKVDSINTITIPAKTRRFRGIEGKKQSYKKAIVTLKEGSTIDLAGGVK